MGTSLLQSIKAAPVKRLADQLAEPRAVDNACDSSGDAVRPEEIVPAAEAHENEGEGAPAPPAPAGTPPAKKPRAAAARAFYLPSTLRLEAVEERVLRWMAGLRARAVEGGAAAARWRAFPTQAAAFAAAAADDPGGERLRVFAVEVSASGARRFVVTGYPEFWRRYEAVPPPGRHHYEIIRQGWPCHLYLDLEYATEHNPGKDGQAAVDAVLGLLRETLATRLGVAIEDPGILELDSSTETKFSRHLIVRLPGAAFASNLHAGAVVGWVVAAAGEARGRDPRAAALFVSKGEGKETCFIDTAVYTKNRAFRLYLSSKAGKTAMLRPTGRFGAPDLRAEQIFMASLVCNVPPEARLLRCFDEADGPPTAGRLRASRAAAGAADQGSSLRTGASPYPALDTFIETVAAGPDPGGPSAAIRGWASLDGGAVLLFTIKGSRWCGNVGRHHRSNGVYYVADLQHGVWFQKCHDPDCTGYRSPATALPPGVAPEVAGGGGGGGEWGAAEEEQAWDAAALAALAAAESGERTLGTGAPDC